MVTRVRNRGCLPILDSEGEILKPLPIECRTTVGPEWQYGLTTSQRLNSYHTLASVRRYAYFRPFPSLIPKDALDLALASSYEHDKDKFPEKVDIVMQRETLGIDTWRRLRNTRDVKAERDAISAAAAAALGGASGYSCSRLPSHCRDVSGVESGHVAHVPHVKYNEFHPVHIGGITERRHPSNVKLMNSSHHSPQTNAGYSRQDSDGNAYVY